MIFTIDTRITLKSIVLEFPFKKKDLPGKMEEPTFQREETDR